MTTLFLMTLAAGFMCILATCRMDEVAWKFVRLIAIFTLFLISFVLVPYALSAERRAGEWATPAAGATGAMALATFCVLALAPVAKHYAIIVRALAALSGMAGIIATWSWGFDGRVWAAADQLSRKTLLGVLAVQMLAACLVGSVTLATTLGHAYLTQTHMTVRPLRRLASIFATAVSLRILSVVAVLAWIILKANDAVSLGAIWNEHRLMLIIRIVIGLAIPAGYAYMIQRTVKIRATQSATGILYFTLVLVYIGELAGQYLVRETGMPF